MIFTIVKVVRRGRDNTRYLISSGDELLFDNDVLYEEGDEVEVAGGVQKVFDKPMIDFRSKHAG